MTVRRVRLYASIASSMVLLFVLLPVRCDILPVIYQTLRRVGGTGAGLYTIGTEMRLCNWPQTRKEKTMIRYRLQFEYMNDQRPEQQKKLIRAVDIDNVLLIAPPSVLETFHALVKEMNLLIDYEDDKVEIAQTDLTHVPDSELIGDATR